MHQVPVQVPVGNFLLQSHPLFLSEFPSVLTARSPHRYSENRKREAAFDVPAPYERGGDVHDVVFPCGQTIGIDGDTIHLYYGAGDSCMALATGSIRALLSWLDSNSSAGGANGF